MGFIRWFYPGIYLKRWILLSLFGIFVIGVGVVHFVFFHQFSSIVMGVFLCLGGLVFVVGGIVNFSKSLVDSVVPEKEKKSLTAIYQKRQLERGPNIVVLGGGTGLSVLLKGLKEYTSNITAIVTMADDGGSSGRLRSEFDVLPPGDIRNCLVALADAEPLMSELFQYRFKGDNELSGHSFGNLFITALSKVTGDFERAVRESSKILAIRGRVVPSTLEKVTLVAEYIDGSKTMGESKIAQRRLEIKSISLVPGNPPVTSEAMDSIKEADAVIFGPGSLYTSIIPNLLVKGVVDCIHASDAVKIYVCNVMSETGETDNYRASDHLATLLDHTKKKIVDYCIVNTSKIPEHMIERYKTEDKYPVVADVKEISKLNVKAVTSDIVSVENCVRHDSKKLARIIIDLIKKV